jgi:aminoglycoside 2'-N-acetyltransferase I
VAIVLAIEVIDSNTIAPSTLQEIRELCTEAYEEDFSHAFELLGPGVHVVGSLDAQIVSHAMWVDRALQVGDRESLRTAYVEAVATRPAFKRRGFGTDVMRRLASEIRDYDLGALSPSDERFYARLGWQAWRGRLFIRTATGMEATPDEGVMILRLEKTPADLDLDAALSAEWRVGELW